MPFNKDYLPLNSYVTRLPLILYEMVGNSEAENTDKKRGISSLLLNCAWW